MSAPFIHMQIDVHWFPRFHLNLEDFRVTVALMGYVIIVYYLDYKVEGETCTVIYSGRAK